MSSSAELSQTFPPRKKLGGARTPKAGFYKRSGCYVPQKKKLPPVIEEDHEEEKPAYVAAPITLPAVSTSTISDEDIGLKHDPAAQQKAVDYIKNVLAWNIRNQKGTQDD